MLVSVAVACVRFGINLSSSSPLCPLVVTCGGTTLDKQINFMHHIQLLLIYLSGVCRSTTSDIPYVYLSDLSSQVAIVEILTSQPHNTPYMVQRKRNEDTEEADG